MQRILHFSFRSPINRGGSDDSLGQPPSAPLNLLHSSLYTDGWCTEAFMKCLDSSFFLWSKLGTKFNSNVATLWDDVVSSQVTSYFWLAMHRQVDEEQIFSRLRLSKSFTPICKIKQWVWCGNARYDANVMRCPTNLVCKTKWARSHQHFWSCWLADVWSSINNKYL